MHVHARMQRAEGVRPLYQLTRSTNAETIARRFSEKVTALRVINSQRELLVPLRMHMRVQRATSCKPSQVMVFISPRSVVAGSPHATKGDAVRAATEFSKSLIVVALFR